MGENLTLFTIALVVAPAVGALCFAAGGYVVWRVLGAAAPRPIPAAKVREALETAAEAGRVPASFWARFRNTVTTPPAPDPKPDPRGPAVRPPVLEA